MSSNGFLNINEGANPVDYNMMIWYASQVAIVGGILSLTMQPYQMDLPDSVLQEFANKCYEINSHYGVPILLRWAHEMNGKSSNSKHSRFLLGPWTTYGMDPVNYVPGYQRIATIIHQTTNLTGKSTKWQHLSN